MRQLEGIVLRSILLLGLGLAVSRPADAFCGFYVSGADANLYANATMVVLLRDGTRTVLSMQNSYQGPPEDFALVVPVPTVLQEENVRTLPPEIFQRVDALAAPRLVEYWEQDPCEVRLRNYELSRSVVYEEMEDGAAPPTEELGVKVEAEFTVAEYQIVILSAKEAGGLDAWLRKYKYNIPPGASALLRPYVEGGTKFFVAKVDPKKVKFEDGRAVLSPLRVHYDSPDFNLPVRLGLLNSAGEQDLLVHILARGQRYEVANYSNAFIPTNIRVMDGVRSNFGGFYESLYKATTAGHPGTVVTEYSWDAGSCDPCPVPAIDEGELLTLGGDVASSQSPYEYTLTRLHYRYDKDGLKEDLVFAAAPPVVGGRGVPDVSGQLTERGASPSGTNNFQGRYVILHPWDGEIACKEPVRGEWGGPPSGAPSQVEAAPSALRAKAAAEVSLASFLAEDLPDLGVKMAAPPAAPVLAPDEEDLEDPRCAAVPAAVGIGGLLLALGIAMTRRRIV